MAPRSSNGDASTAILADGTTPWPFALVAAAAVTGGDFHSLVADPTTPGRLFVGGHENLSVSSDNGRTWSEVEALRDTMPWGWGCTDGASTATCSSPGSTVRLGSRST